MTFRMRRTVRIACLSVLLAVTAYRGHAADEQRSAGGLIQLDPFAQATNGFKRCPSSSPPQVTPEQMRIIAHERAERGTYCALEGRCEPGGAYRRDPEVNERVRAAIAQDKRFAGTSVAVTTTRRFVTLMGCVHSASERRALVDLVKAQAGVDRVFDETRLNTASPKPASP